MWFTEEGEVRMGIERTRRCTDGTMGKSGLGGELGRGANKRSHVHSSLVHFLDDVSVHPFPSADWYEAWPSPLL
jgi:hypothetical protein